MILQQLPPGSGTDEGDIIEAFLNDFAAKARDFKQVYDGYMAKRVELDHVTRALSEATADAEQAFSVHSIAMTIDQLQRFGSLQKAFDTMMEHIFSEEIRRNRETCVNAIENGEYFLVGLIHKGIESSIHMLHSKDRIKVDKERKLAELAQGQQTIMGVLKVVKALEQGLQAEMDLDGLLKIEKVVGLYVSYFKDLPRTDFLSACDRRVLRLLKQHFDTLLASPSGPITGEHMNRCCKVLSELPSGCEALIEECRQLAPNFNRK